MLPSLSRKWSGDVEFELDSKPNTQKVVYNNIFSPIQLAAFLFQYNVSSIDAFLRPTFFPKEVIKTIDEPRINFTAFLKQPNTSGGMCSTRKIKGHGKIKTFQSFCEIVLNLLDCNDIDIEKVHLYSTDFLWYQIEECCLTQEFISRPYFLILLEGGGFVKLYRHNR